MTVGVMTARLSAFSRAISTGARVAALSVALACAGAAQAGPESLRAALSGHGRSTDGGQLPGPPIARYVSEDGDVFILDLSQSLPLLKFDNSQEVWVLRPQPGPRGDTIYKNDLGESV